MDIKLKLKELLNNSYAVYSNYNVSCVLETKDNNYLYGVNVENASYGATICAERSAITNAITNGYKKHDFKRIYIMNASDKIGTCCMLCRQVFLEFFDMDMEVIMYNNKFDEKKLTVKDMCPYPFSEDDLK